MSDFLMAGRRPADPRELLAQISARYLDRETALKVFVAAVYDDQRYIRACIEHAFETWRARTSQ
jgi:hypothetical protein